MPSSSGSEERVREQRKIKLLIPRKEPTGGGGGGEQRGKRWGEREIDVERRRRDVQRADQMMQI